VAAAVLPEAFFRGHNPKSTWVMGATRANEGAVRDGAIGVPCVDCEPPKPLR